jgi:hypothetical protein|nr:MAG TPA: hypothetical protein [Caudoviricetes sp.]
MAVKTIHQDTHGDEMRIYERHDKIHIDGCFDGERIAWRGIFTPKQAREIANRLNDLAYIMEGK